MRSIILPPEMGLHMMRAVLVLAFLTGTTLAAAASEGFEIVIPGRAGVPIIINGVDVSYSVLEGDWGLAKGNKSPPAVYGGRYVDPTPNVGHYYPSLGHAPGYGRLEIEPPANRKLPPQAESYYRSWSAQSTPQPVQPEVPAYPPPVIMAPQRGGDGMWQEFPNPPPDPTERKQKKVP
jgi:hypothetical protein